MQGTRTRAWTHTTPPERRPSVAPVGLPRMHATASHTPMVLTRRARDSFCAVPDLPRRAGCGYTTPPEGVAMS